MYFNQNFDQAQRTSSCSMCWDWRETTWLGLEL